VKLSVMHVMLESKTVDLTGEASFKRCDSNTNLSVM
jgi:hypothetical protein